MAVPVRWRDDSNPERVFATQRCSNLIFPESIAY
jgi:hypothetical protein